MFFRKMHLKRSKQKYYIVLDGEIKASAVLVHKKVSKWADDWIDKCGEMKTFYSIVSEDELDSWGIKKGKM